MNNIFGQPASPYFAKSAVHQIFVHVTDLECGREIRWNFQIGRNQVCEVFPEDNKSRAPSADDGTHGQKVVIALPEIIRFMVENSRIMANNASLTLE